MSSELRIDLSVGSDVEVIGLGGIEKHPVGLELAALVHDHGGELESSALRDDFSIAVNAEIGGADAVVLGVSVVNKNGSAGPLGLINLSTDGGLIFTLGDVDHNSEVFFRDLLLSDELVREFLESFGDWLDEALNLSGSVSGSYKHESDGLSDSVFLAEVESVFEDDVFSDHGVELSVDPHSLIVHQVLMSLRRSKEMGPGVIKTSVASEGPGEWSLAEVVSVVEGGIEEHVVQLKLVVVLKTVAELVENHHGRLSDLLTLIEFGGLFT